MLMLISFMNATHSKYTSGVDLCTFAYSCTIERAVAMNTQPYEVAVTMLNGSVYIGSDRCQWITSNHKQLLSC